MSRHLFAVILIASSNCDFLLCGAAYDLDGVEQQVKELRHWKEEETGPKEVLAKGQGTFRTP
jgi:hypothetical protein